MRQWLSAVTALARRAPMPGLLVLGACGWSLLAAWPSRSGFGMTYCGDPRLAATVLADLRLASAFAAPRAWVVGWAAMLLAMTPPLLAGPVSAVWRSALVRRRPAALALFAVGYALAWMAAGAGLQAAGVILAALCGSSALAIAGGLVVAWRVSPTRVWAEDRCHRAPRLRVFGAAALLDSLAYGLRNGGWCVLACWPLMLAPFVAAHAHMAVMAASALVMTIDRYSPRREERHPLPQGQS